MILAIAYDQRFALGIATLHALMVQPYPTEASPAQLADATHVTRAAMTRRLDRLVRERGDRGAERGTG